MAELSVLECILRLVLSALFGGIIGLEREIRLKVAGIRTHLIVSFASCMMMLVSKYGFFDMQVYDFVKLDPSRIAAGIVTAIGFLGAGTIFARSRGVTGVTTAAGLWATVGIGMATGAGLYAASIFGAVFIILIQAVLHRDHVLLGHVSAILYIELEDRPGTPGQLQDELARLGLEPCGARYERGSGVLSVELQMNHLPCPDRELGQRLAPLIQQPYIKSVRW